MNIKKIFKCTSLSVTPLVALPIIVACAGTVDSEGLIEQKKKIIANYELNANIRLWDSILKNQYSSSLGENSLEEAFLNNESDFFKDAWEAFDYFQSFSLANEQLFLIKNINLWSGKGYLSQDGSADSNLQTKAKLELEFGQSLNKDQFRLVWNNPNTKIQEQVKKMLIAKEYLTNSKEEDIKKSKEWLDNETANPDSNEYHLVRKSNIDYFLNIHLLKKQIGDVWEYQSSESSTLATYSKFRIKTAKDFNTLSKNNLSLVTKKQSSNIALATNDSLDTSKLFAYKGLQMNMADNGDLNYALGHLQEQNTIKTGFLDNSTSLIYSINDFNKSKVFLNKKEIIPAITEEGKTKDKFTITPADFTLSPTDSEMKYEIIAVYPDNSTKSETKKAFVAIKMSLRNDESKSHVYRVAVNWQGTTPFYTPSVEQNVPEINSSVSVLSSDSKSIKATYINKIVPLATEVVTTGEGDDKKVNAYFSLEKTPWSTTEQKTKLAFALSMLTDTILSSALSFYEDLGYKIDKKNTDIFGKEPKEEPKEGNKEENKNGEEGQPA